jgi:hypothetical protein
LTYVLTGRIDDAQGVYGRLQEEYPAGAVGNDVAEMAETFWEAYLQDESVTEGCSKVIAVAEEYASVLGFFNQNYGYANPWWEPRDLCPFIH